MKTILSTNPSFTPGAAGAGTLNFSTTPGFTLNRLLAVLNQTRNVIIYGATVSGKGYTAFNAGTKVLTLAADTSTGSSGDSLICIYDDPAATVSITGALPAGSNTIGNVGVSGAVEITNDAGNAIPVSAASLPLPTGAATNTTLTDGTQKTQVTSLPALPAGSNTIGNVGVSGAVEITNDVGNSIPVSVSSPLPAGSNTIGNVGVTGAVEITNDAGNAIPVSAAALPLPTGASTEATLSSLRLNVSEPGVESTSTFNGIPQFSVIQIAGSVSGTPVVQCQSITAIISSTWNFVGTIVIEGSVDQLAWKQLDLINLTTNASASAITTLGEVYQFSTVGWAYIRIRVSAYTSGSGQVTFRRSQAPARATSSGAASNVTVTNFPATQAVSGTVEITNDVGNAIPVSLSAGSNLVGRVQLGANAFTVQNFSLSIAPQGTTLLQAWLYKISFSVENADTGYGLEPIYAKIWFSTTPTPTVGVSVPSITLCVCDGVRIYENYEFLSAIQITALYQAYIAVTKNRSATDATPVSASVAAVLYTRNN